MKSLIKTVAVAAALVVPAICFAQSAPQSAVQSVAQQPAHTNTTQPADPDGYGGVASGMSKSGRPAYNPANDIGMSSIFMHH